MTPECGWRVSGFCVRRKERIATVGVLVAPDQDAALREALRRWGTLFQDLRVEAQGEAPGALV